MYDAVPVIGQPGSGKGTVSKLLAEKLPEFYHLSTGNLVRTAIKESHSHAHILSDYGSRGVLPPDEIVFDLLTEELNRASGRQDYKPDTQILLLDGWPRNMNEVEMSKSLFDIRALLQLSELPESELVKRMTEVRKREYDELKIIKSRIAEYSSESLPVVEHYRQKGITVYTLQASKPEEEVANMALTAATGILNLQR